MMTQICPKTAIREASSLKSTLKTLYIDDDPDDFLLFRLMMHGAGFEIVTSFVPERDAHEVVEHLMKSKPHRPDAILVDIRLALVDGVHVLRAIREHPEFNQIPVVLISGSGYYLDTVKREHPDLTVDGFLTKPFTVQELTDVLKSFSHCMGES